MSARTLLAVSLLVPCLAGAGESVPAELGKDVKLTHDSDSREPAATFQAGDAETVVVEVTGPCVEQLAVWQMDTSAALLQMAGKPNPFINPDSERSGNTVRMRVPVSGGEYGVWVMYPPRHGECEDVEYTLRVEPGLTLHPVGGGSAVIGGGLLLGKGAGLVNVSANLGVRVWTETGFRAVVSGTQLLSEPISPTFFGGVGIFSDQHNAGGLDALIGWSLGLAASPWGFNAPVKPGLRVDVGILSGPRVQIIIEAHAPIPPERIEDVDMITGIGIGF